MCGIAGFLTPRSLSSESDGLAIAQAMGRALVHRGPDGRGEWLDATAGIGLSHRRLAIVDLTHAGLQPMTSADGRWVIVFNGEIYNHLELRSELHANSQAPAWRGGSDTETLLAAISAWGIKKAIERCVGMFAVAAWDRSRKSLTLIRDRLGEKPLYWGRCLDGTLVFGSEIKALRAHPRFYARVDRGALAMLLNHGYVPAPWSIHEGVFKLMPGTTATFQSKPGTVGEPHIETYWSIDDVAEKGLANQLLISREEAVEELERLLKQSISGQRMADVPLGAFLSGGIDSSVTTAVLQSMSNSPVHTFTIGFHEKEFDESSHARAVAAHLGTNHTELMVSTEDALRVIPQLDTVFDEPFADASQIPTLLVSRLARAHATVCISGDAGDELFGGYERYRMAQRISRVPLSVRRAVGATLSLVGPRLAAAALKPFSPVLPAELRAGDMEDRLSKLASVMGAKSNDALYQDMVSFWQDAAPALGASSRSSAFTSRIDQRHGFEARMMLLDLKTYLPDDILTKVDRAAMNASLETRVPMLDHRIVEFAQRLPLEHKMGLQGKQVLRGVLDKYVPRQLIDRPKMGFGIPIHQWLRGPLKTWAEDLLNPASLRSGGLIDEAPVTRLWLQHQSGRNDWGYQLWPVLMFQQWHRQQEGFRR